MQIKEFMTHDHRECDELFSKVENEVSNKDFSKAKELFEDFKAKTLCHFSMEEDILFPKFTNKTGMVGGPTEVMKAEHNQIKMLLEKMQKALDEGKGSDFFGIGETMMILVAQHNMKEEQMLYNMIQMHLGDENDAIVKELESRQ